MELIVNSPWLLDEDCDSSGYDDDLNDSDLKNKTATTSPTQTDPQVSQKLKSRWSKEEVNFHFILV